MSRVYEDLKPTNRHLLIIPHFKENKSDSGVLLPEDYSAEEERYIEATVVKTAEDCARAIRSSIFNDAGSQNIVVDRSMIQEIKVRDKVHYMILENYVMGVFGRW